MENAHMDSRTVSAPLEEIAHRIMVVLVDYQPFVAALLKCELTGETDISFHYRQDPYPQPDRHGS